MTIILPCAYNGRELEAGATRRDQFAESTGASMAIQEQLNKAGLDYIEGLRNTAARLWVLACEAEGVPADSRFVVFSDDNRAARLCNAARARLSEARAQYAAGGYVGLRIERGGRAAIPRRRARR